MGIGLDEWTLETITHLFEIGLLKFCVHPLVLMSQGSRMSSRGPPFWDRHALRAACLVTIWLRLSLEQFHILHRLNLSSLRWGLTPTPSETSDCASHPDGVSVLVRTFPIQVCLTQAHTTLTSECVSQTPNEWVSLPPPLDEWVFFTFPLAN